MCTTSIKTTTNNPLTRVSRRLARSLSSRSTKNVSAFINWVLFKHHYFIDKWSILFINSFSFKWRQLQIQHLDAVVRTPVNNLQIRGDGSQISTKICIQNTKTLSHSTVLRTKALKIAARDNPHDVIHTTTTKTILTSSSTKYRLVWLRSVCDGSDT